MAVAQQQALVQAADPADDSVAARCQALGLARSSFYYQPRGESARNLELMRLLDEEFTDHNFKGVLGMRYHLRLAGLPSMPSACAAWCARWATSRSIPNRA